MGLRRFLGIAISLACLLAISSTARSAGLSRLQRWRWAGANAQTPLSVWVNPNYSLSARVAARTDPVAAEAFGTTDAVAPASIGEIAPAASRPPVTESPMWFGIDPNSADAGRPSWVTGPSTPSMGAPTSLSIAYNVPPPQPYTVDALINMAGGPYPQAGLLTTGNARPWYESPVVSRVFGGMPDAAQRADFTQAVAAEVEKTYKDSGVPISVTTDPAVSAPHTLSVVSGASYAGSPEAIGITDLGRNGFSFIDRFGYANSVDELEMAVARNVAHELMHAFGVEHHDMTGTYLDAAVTPWEVLVDPNTQFGAAAVADLLAQDFRATGGTAVIAAEMLVGDDGTLVLPPSIAATPIPEPSSAAVWLAAASIAFAGLRRRFAVQHRQACRD